MREIDLSAIRARLARTGGPGFWRSLDELADTEAFESFLKAEFPEAVTAAAGEAGRRQFIKLMGASLALAGAACTRIPRETIVPYVRAPEEFVPGKPTFYATAMPLGGAAQPVLVESHMGRPTKVEPNPEHPLGGGTDVWSQASVLTLYDPDRSTSPKYLGRIRPWSALRGVLRGAAIAQQSSEGAGLRILTGPVSSPTLLDQIRQLRAALPMARWHEHDPLGRDGVRAGALQAYGVDLEPRYHLENADVILSLDADFLSEGPARLAMTRAFTERRRVSGTTDEMSRLYVAESLLTNTGARADHRLGLRASAIEPFARAVAAAVGVAGVAAAEAPGAPAEWIGAVASDLRANGARSLVIAGDRQPAAVHALAHAINQALGSVGTTVEMAEPLTPADLRPASLADLADDMEAGSVDVLVIVGSNPVQTAPSDLQFAERLQNVPLRIHVGLFEDETAEYCHWHGPEVHYLESWSDARAADGTVSIVQPLIAPLYEGGSAHDVIAALSGRPEDRTAYEMVREYWTGQYGAWQAGVPAAPVVPAAAEAGAAETQAAEAAVTAPASPHPALAGGDFETSWRRWLHAGFIPGTALPARTATLGGGAIGSPSTAPDGTEVTFSADPCVYDGQFANNGWLQELPKPLTKLTWDNVALVSPATAERLDIESGDVLIVEVEGRSVEAPAWVAPGQPDDSINLQLGYGRRRGGQIATGIGYDAYPLRRSTALWFAGGSVRPAGRRYPLASTQSHFAMEDRHLVRVGTLEHYREDPEFAKHLTHVPPDDMTLYPNTWTYEGYSWGMVIDLNSCTGCNACVVACQAENNISVVGKDQVAVGREMHWIRVDRYYEGDPANPSAYTQPVLCMQCENAPCEVVCPVGATVHSSEGLNDMVYNRCVGTRYCSNNCPYKVRRFNFLLYADWDTPTLKMQRNPDVTVRSRGIMEKCTYCVQRINEARIHAKLEDRSIRDGEVVTACEAACAAGAIVFGNLNDPESRVTGLKRDPRDYTILAELNTRPRTSYLAALRNPNPALEPTTAAAVTTEN